MKTRQGRQAGFTLAEVAVTIVIVGIGLVLILQGLNTAKMTSAHTANMKLARELGLFTMSQIEGGLYWEEDLEDLKGSYADVDYPNFFYEVNLGADSSFVDYDPNDPRDPRYQDYYSTDDDDDRNEDDEEESTQPYEMVQIRVTFPQITERTNTLVLERWLPWAQVYGPDEDEEAAAEGAAGAPDEEGSQDG